MEERGWRGRGRLLYFLFKEAVSTGRLLQGGLLIQEIRYFTVMTSSHFELF